MNESTVIAANWQEHLFFHSFGVHDHNELIHSYFLLSSAWLKTGQLRNKKSEQTTIIMLTAAKS